MSLLFVAESSYMTRKTLTQCMYHFIFLLFSFWIKVAFKKSGGAKFMHIMQCKTEIRIEKKISFHCIIFICTTFLSLDFYISAVIFQLS